MMKSFSQRLSDFDSLCFIVLAICFCSFTFFTYYVSSWWSFISWLPILLILHFNGKQSKWLQIFFLLLLFNLISTFWLASISLIKAICIWLYSSLLLFLPFVIYRLTVQCGSELKLLGIGILVMSWLVLELSHHYWNLGWPWLSLGNIFGSNIQIVQWYQYTGWLGGTFWILLTNIILFSMIVDRRRVVPKCILLFSVIIVPTYLSLLLTKKTLSAKGRFPVYLVQPNVSDTSNTLGVVDSIFKVLEQDYCTKGGTVFLTETFITERTPKDAAFDSRHILRIKKYLRKQRQVSVISGIVLMEHSSASDAIFDPSLGVKYHLYNSLVRIDTSGRVLHRSKFRLVPVEEYKKGYLKIFPFESQNFSLGDEFSSFRVSDSTTILPLICFEIMFGCDIAKAVSKDNKIGFISMLGNEQSLVNKFERDFYTNISKVRAVENQKCVVKVSNQGSCEIVNPQGKVIFKLKEHGFAIGYYEVPIFSRQSFFSTYIRYIELGVFILFFFLIILSIRIKWKI